MQIFFRKAIKRFLLACLAWHCWEKLVGEFAGNGLGLKGVLFPNQKRDLCWVDLLVLPVGVNEFPTGLRITVLHGCGDRNYPASRVHQPKL